MTCDLVQRPQKREEAALLLRKAQEAGGQRASQRRAKRLETGEVLAKLGGDAQPAQVTYSLLLDCGNPPSTQLLSYLSIQVSLCFVPRRGAELTSGLCTHGAEASLQGLQGCHPETQAWVKVWGRLRPRLGQEAELTAPALQRQGSPGSRRWVHPAALSLCLSLWFLLSPPALTF